MRPLYKKASVRVRNIDELSKAIGNMAHFFNDSPDNIIRGVLNDGGSGSMFLDGGRKVMKHTLRFGGEKVPHDGKIFKEKRINTMGDKLYDSSDDKIWDFKKRIIDADMRAGSFLEDKTRKGIFSDNIEFAKNKGEDGVADEVINIRSDKLTAPLQKINRKVLPLAGGFYLSSKFYPAEDGDNFEKV